MISWSIYLGFLRLKETKRNRGKEKKILCKNWEWPQKCQTSTDIRAQILMEYHQHFPAVRQRTNISVKSFDQKSCWKKSVFVLHFRDDIIILKGWAAWRMRGVVDVCYVRWRTEEGSRYLFQGRGGLQSESTLAELWEWERDMRATAARTLHCMDGHKDREIDKDAQMLITRLQTVKKPWIILCNSWSDFWVVPRITCSFI